MTCLASNARVLDHPKPLIEAGHSPQGLGSGSVSALGLLHMLL